MQETTGRPYSICISGWYGSGNTGDEAILTQFIREIVSGPHVTLTILPTDARRAYALYARNNISVIEHPVLIGRGGLVNLIRGRTSRLARAVRSADLFILGGGSLLHDRSSLRTLIRNLDEIWIAKLFGRKVALYAIGVGPLRRRSARWLVAMTVRKCDLIAVRDNGSKNLLIAIGVPENKIEIVADPALLLIPQAVVASRLHASPDDLQKFKDNAIGVFLIDDLGIDSSHKLKIVTFLAKAFDALHDLIGVSFVFVPMMSEQGDDDRLIAREVVQRMAHRDFTHLIEQTLAPDEMVWLAGQFRANITMRLHAFLFSMAMETPAIAISPDPKVTNAAHDFGLQEYVIPFESLSDMSLKDAVLGLEESRDEYIKILRRSLPERRRAAQKMFDLMHELVAARSHCNKALDAAAR